MPRRPFPNNNINGDGRAMKFLRPIFRLQRRITKGAPLLVLARATLSPDSHVTTGGCIVADIERLAMELASLSPDDRELVLQRLQIIGSRTREVGNRLQRRSGSSMWGDLIGERLYDTYGVAVAVVQNIKLRSENNDDLRFDPHDSHRYARRGHTTIEIISYGITRSDM